MKNSSAIIFDDHQLFAHSFALALHQLSLFANVEILHSVQEVNDFCDKNSENAFYLFSDYFVPGISVMEFWHQVKSSCPLSKILVISSLSSYELIENLQSNSNIQGLISKSACFSEITRCINLVNKGSKYLSPYFIDILNKKSIRVQHQSFTPREMEILHHISLGETIEQTAAKLNLSRHTIVSHRRNMMEKVDCHSITELLAFAIKNGLILAS